MNPEIEMFFQFIGQLTCLAGGYWMLAEIYREIKNGGDDE